MFKFRGARANPSFGRLLSKSMHHPELLHRHELVILKSNKLFRLGFQEGDIGMGQLLEQISLIIGSLARIVRNRSSDYRNMNLSVD
jgi:hypothetical protein